MQKNERGADVTPNTLTFLVKSLQVQAAANSNPIDAGGPQHELSRHQYNRKDLNFHGKMEAGVLFLEENLF
jgi:hypothetical protein